MRSRFNKMFEIRTGTCGGSNVLENSAANDSAVARSLPANVSVLTVATARIRAGEIIGWRFWKLRNGLLESVFVTYTWWPRVFERSSSKQAGFKNPGYHAFRDKEQVEHEASIHAWSLSVIGSAAMWGEVIERQRGWRSEYAAVRSIIITGDIRVWTHNLIQ